MNIENQNTEFKESWRDEYLKCLCGFANAQGGRLYIGIDDRGNVCGVENVHSQTLDMGYNNSHDVADNIAEQLTERQRVIMLLINNHVADGVAQNVTVNTKYLSERLGLNRKTIQRDLAVLQERNLIQWVGSDKTGHWETVKKE